MKVIELNPEEIIVGERFRKELPKAELERLAQSILEVGQLQPIGIYYEDGKPYLLYGHRRLEACKIAKIKVKATILDKPSALNAQIIEFLENSQRSDFTPLEKAKAVKQIHEALSNKEPNWSVSKTAELLGLTRPYISDLLRIAREDEEGAIPEELKDASISELRKITSKKEKLERIKKSVEQVHKKPFRAELINADALSPEIWAQGGLQEGSFHIVLTDPPYGMDFAEQSKIDKSLGSFQDNPLDYLSPEWIRSLLNLFNKALHPEDGLVLCFCSLEQWFLLRNHAHEYGLSPYSKPLIWYKKVGGHPYKADKLPTDAYEVIFFAKRDPLLPLFKATKNVFEARRLYASDGSKIHPTQKPVELLKELLEAFAFPHYELLDPFAGSGSSILAAKERGLKQAVGIELDPEFFRKAKAFLSKNGIDLDHDQDQEE